MKTQAMSWMRGRAGRYAGMVAGLSRWRGRSRVLMAAAAGMVLAAGVFASPAAASASTPSITLKPTSGPPTTKVSVTGAGFGTSETVVVDFGATQVATAATSSTGTFTAAFTVPKTAPPGSDLVTATGQTSKLSATAHFLVRTNWPQLRFGVTGTGVNPYENVISTSNVAKLTQAWQEPSTLAVTNISPPSVYNGVLYTSGAADLYAINPVTGAVMWTGTAGPSGSVHTPAVVNGVAYIASSDGKFYAYSAKASRAHCTGTPPKETCKPLWTAPIEGAGSDVQSSAVVSGGVVYVAAGYELYAFSAGGCGSATCNPLWVSAACSGCGGQSPVSGVSTPAVAGGVVYAGGLDGLWAYSANGSNGCSGTPKTCRPLWHGSDATVAVSGPTSTTAVAVVNGVAYISADNDVYAFSTACSSTCKPLWSYTDPNGFDNFSSPAVSGGVVFANDSNAALYAFSASTGTPLWTAPAPGADSGAAADPAVANGVVYAGYKGYIEAFSSTGTTGCSGSPKVCAPLWTLAGARGGGPGGIWDSPMVVNGVVYAAEWNGTPLSAYKLP